MNIMGSIRIYKGMLPLSAEEIEEIFKNAPKSDDEIDFSDIPPTSKEQLERMKANRIRRKKLEKLQFA